MENYLKKVKFVKSIVDVKEAPNDYSHEVLFVGKSNVGKSSLINALVNNKKMAFTSSQPGHTRLLNYFSVEDNFYLVDCPGYGYSKKKDHAHRHRSRRRYDDDRGQGCDIGSGLDHRR